MEIIQIDNNNFRPFKQDIMRYIRMLTICEKDRRDNVDYYVDEKIKSIPLYIEDRSALIFVGIEDDKVVLFLWAYKVSENTMHLTQLIVDERYQRRGYAKEALCILIEKMREENMQYLNLNAAYNNLAALNLYKSLGFNIEKVFMERKIV